jgi:hypothetical protein
MAGLKLRAACLLGVLCCAWVACALAAEGEDATATVQNEEVTAYRRHHYYNPNPCLSDLPEHYTASLASMDSNYCSEHHHQYKHHKHHKRDYGYEDNDEDDYPKGRCPSGPQPATYVNLLRSNDTIGGGVWGMQLVSADAHFELLSQDNQVKDWCQDGRRLPGFSTPYICKLMVSGQQSTGACNCLQACQLSFGTVQS